MRSAVVVSCLAVMLALGGSCGGGGTGTGGGAGGGSGGGGGGTQLDCPGLISCASACNQTDQACLNGCGAQATSDAVTKYNMLVDCVNAHSCTTSDCLQMNCNAELTACTGSSGTGGGAGGGGGGGGSGVGDTTSGKCVMSASYCWDYTLTVTTNHNDGVEHYVYYEANAASSGQAACTNSSFSTPMPGPWDNAAISQRNLTQKQTACSIGGGTFTQGAACSLSGSMGHCTNTIANVWDGTTLTATTTAAWSVP